MTRTKTTKLKYNIPPSVKNQSTISQLPYNGTLVDENKIAFSFSAFDREHKYFNLGGKAEDKTVGGKWFLDLLDCLKSVNGKTIQELRHSIHDLHPIDWNNANVKPPIIKQAEYWQFRLNKSRGRVIGILIDNVFYVVWLDPHHNLTDSEGYGGVNQYRRPKSEYETLLEENTNLKKYIAELEKLIK